MVLELAMLSVVMFNALPDSIRRRRCFRPLAAYAHLFILKWDLFDAVGLMMILIPIVTIFVNFDCRRFVCNIGSDHHFCYLTLVALLHFCNFAQLRSPVKSATATVAALLLIFLVCYGVCRTGNVEDDSASFSSTAAATCPRASSSSSSPTPHSIAAASISMWKNSSSSSSSWNNSSNAATVDDDVLRNNDSLSFSGDNSFMPSVFVSVQSGQNVEIVLDIVLLLILVYFINYQLEKGYRLSFHGNLQADNDKKNMEQQRDQADWLLR